MRRERAYLLLAVVLAVPVLIIGCHGDRAGPAPGPVIPDAVLQAAVNTQVSPNPEASAADSNCSVELWTMLNTPPATSDEVRDKLVEFTANVNANPDQAACQLGLCLLMLARAADDVATDLGVDIFEEIAGIDLQALVTLASAEGPGGLVTAYKNLFPNVAGEADTAARDGLFADLDGRLDEKLEAALRAYMLPVLYNPSGGVFQRLAKLADCGYADALVTLGAVGGPTFTLYTADFNMLAAGVETLYAMLLKAMAYNCELNGWTPPDDPNDLDSNKDGFLTPNEYFPPQPFGTLKPAGATELGIARDRYLDAIRRTREGLNTIPDDRTDLLDMLFMDLGMDLPQVSPAQFELPETSAEALMLMLDHFEALLTGEQTLDLEYWKEGQGHSTMPFRVNLSRQFTSPVADFRSLAPTLTIAPLGVDLQNGDDPQSGVTLGFQDFPDPTFNGMFPDVVALLVVLPNADWLQLNHADQTWGPIPVADILELLGGGGMAIWPREDDLLLLEDWLDELLQYIIVV